MKKKILLFCSLFVMFTLTGYNQVKKIPLDHSVYEKWKLLQNAQISNNGNLISYEINPQKGDGWLYLYSVEKNRLDSFQRAMKPGFRAIQLTLFLK